MKPTAWRGFAARLAGAGIMGIAALLSSCALVPQRNARVTDLRDGVTVVTYPAEMRGAYLVPRTADETVCSEPAPDVGLKSVAELSGKLSAQIPQGSNLNAEAAASVTGEAIQLAGRSQLVLVAREMLYSLCSVSRNSSLTPVQITGIYSEIAKVITILAKADAKNAEARYLEASGRAQTVVQAQNRKVDRILAFLTDAAGKLIRGPDGRYTKLEELFKRVDEGGGPKLNDWAKSRLRSAVDAADMRHVLLDVTESAIDPLYDALPK